MQNSSSLTSIVVGMLVDAWVIVLLNLMISECGYWFDWIGSDLYVLK